MIEKSPLYSVSDLNNLVKRVLEDEPGLSYISVKGEISSYKEYPSATYFDIKDDRSILTCVMWGSYASRLSFKPKVGDEVVVFGSVSIYAQKGRYQFSASSMSLFGKGDALLALEALKKKLEAEGLFDASKKKAIPKFPNRIGIIVGKDSAAEADLIANISRRWPIAELYVYHALVQGKSAPEDIIRALDLSSKDELDVLILARGGGSYNDLDAFNDERLVRAFAAMETPKIAAVGHEIDFTLIDFVADKRVSTPTGAAEASTPDIEEIKMGLIDSESQLISYLNAKIRKEETRFLSLSERKFFLSPSSIYQKGEEELKALKDRLNLSMKNLLEKKESNLSLRENTLLGLDHHRLLERGYSIAYDESGKIIKSIGDIKKGDKIKTLLKDGSIVSILEEKENGKQD